MPHSEYSMGDIAYNTATSNQRTLEVLEKRVEWLEKELSELQANVERYRAQKVV